ncbi:MAG: cation:proton antiporter [Thiohalocapsa sp.]|uniref:cation:proton antiporter family protein n=1 Tax=Thiohalocapsa sp. TaxID=2497641 RepID=UPI0025F2A8AD|nr:cation:proton antiporter family protein [Thiohalocapsa sp.]MCG6942968.1 cation:proton antiporter [Thiohalocapsa sp.]
MFDAITWIAVAFGAGVAAKQYGLPPLVGYLVAGFVLHGLGAESGPLIETLSELGVTLLLFTIGLKLKPKSLAAPQVWGVASLHMVAIVALLVPLLLTFGNLGLPHLADMEYGPALVLAFALSFSSTVFAVKVLEEKGEMGSLYGTIAIGILIVQDLIAVLFLAFTAGKIPTFWALGLLAVFYARPLLFWLLERVGHGELLLLFGLTLGLGFSELCELARVKGDLGALVIGVLVAQHPKSGELAKALLGLKDLFLVGFFLSIGLTATPSLDMLPVVILLLAALLLKGFLFEQLLLGFRLRARTALLGALTLFSYSEFGLIVAAVANKNGWLSSDWLAIVAITVALSFVIASPLNAQSHALYELFSARLRRQERSKRLDVEREIDPGDADVMIVGMGRVGRGAYDFLVQERGLRPVGIDADPDSVKRHKAAGRNVVQGSATDADFWHRLHLDDGHIKLVLLAMPQAHENVFAAEHLLKEGFRGSVGAIAKFPDDEAALRAAGVHQVFNLYAEAGAGLAQHVCSALTPSADDPDSGAPGAGTSACVT